MTKHEYDIVRQIIDNERDYNELKALKEYIDNKINSQENNVYKNRDVIYEKLTEFVDRNFYGTEKDQLKIDSLIESIRDIKGIDDVYVGDLIDININDITSSRHYCGEITIYKLNDALKKEGLSIYSTLETREINKLDEIREEKELKLK